MVAAKDGGGSVDANARLRTVVDKAKAINSHIKTLGLKVIQSQTQGEQIRVTGKNRDDLQEAIALLRGKQDTMKLPMQFGNFRD